MRHKVRETWTAKHKNYNIGTNGNQWLKSKVRSQSAKIHVSYQKNVITSAKTAKTAKFSKSANQLYITAKSAKLRQYSIQYTYSDNTIIILNWILKGACFPWVLAGSQCVGGGGAGCKTSQEIYLHYRNLLNFSWYYGTFSAFNVVVNFTNLKER